MVNMGINTEIMTLYQDTLSAMAPQHFPGSICSFLITLIKFQMTKRDHTKIRELLETAEGGKKMGKV